MKLKYRSDLLIFAFMYYYMWSNYKFKKNGLQLNSFSGLLNGDMPTLGASMSYKVIPKGLPGYEDYHAIQITYNMSSGVQDARHAFPGSPYYAIGKSNF